MELIIIRHAIAEERDRFGLLGLDDSQRPLTKEGIKKFKKLSLKLKKLIGPVDLIASSPYERAKQTAKLVSAQYPKVQSIISPTLEPGIKPDIVAKWLNKNIKKKNSRIVIIGHEPQLSILSTWLLFGTHESRLILKKGGALSIDFTKAVGAKSGILNWLLTPKCLTL